MTGHSPGPEEEFDRCEDELLDRLETGRSSGDITGEGTGRRSRRVTSGRRRVA
ncbi:hypothetical protein SRB17_77260 [Streptomyces sp. RB17]|nr:hypothetical protein [Streptomyces sp. RB17]